MTDFEKITHFLASIISNMETMLEDERVERDSEEPISFYELGLDRDGMPNSFGNADDVYSDGFSNGEYAGRYDLAKELFKLLGE